MPVIKKPFTLAPLNDNPVVLSGSNTSMTIQGGFSHKQGFPTIKFSIPPQPTMLEMSSLRLVGQVLIKKADATVLVARNNSAEYSNGRYAANSVKGTIENVDANMIPQTALNLPNWGGIKNVIDKVVVQSKKSLIELTSVNNYGQYSGITECYNNNGDDYLRSPITNALACGTHATNSNRRLLSASLAGANEAVSLSSANDRMIGQFFSIPIAVDLLGGQDLFLDDDYLGGLLLTIHLANDNAVFNNKYNRTKGSFVGPNDQSALSYVLKNIRLEGRYVVPDEQDLAQIPPSMNLDSRLNLINDIHSSVNANAYTPQLQSVKSMVNVFMDSDQSNSFAKNQNNFRRVVGEKSNQQARNGLRLPHNYETLNKPNFESATEQGGGEHSEKLLQFPALAMGDSETRKQFERALLDGSSPYHSSASLKTTNSALSEDIQDGALGADAGLVDNTKVDCVGIGADFSYGIGMTQNFVNQDYNLTLRSGVNTGNAKLSANRNGAVDANPLLQQTFIRYNSQFDSQSLVKVI